jgi:hypothetical protein
MVVIHKKDQSVIAPKIIAIAPKIMTDCAENNGWKLIADVPK